jgi:regulator of protease activity HflC (stomatin/prohibitin superfamily)
MRTDHYAYQRAAKVAGLGLLLQLAMGLSLLIFGRVAGDLPLVISSVYVLPGVLVWLSLVVIFHQHKLERLESLEEDELAAARGGTSSVFDASEEIHVAARRLRLMHTWLMPIVSLVLAALLALLGFVLLAGLKAAETTEYTRHLGWAVAICLSLAAVSFVFSRFVAGMARQPAWQNLRGGAAYMVGNSLVLLAIATGIVFRFFGEDKTEVLEAVCYAVPIFMILVAVEMVLNFILNLYRPRIPGETPRPAFDSKGLSLLTAPDSLVRSLNEAVNYQFGFDVTSSWGYQLLLRSFVWLLLLGAAAIVALNMMVVVEPNQQAVKLSGGRIVGGVHGSGIMWKWPWPFQTAAIYDVTNVRDLPLTAQYIGQDIAHLWNLELETDEEIEPFVVGTPQYDAQDTNPDDPVSLNKAVPGVYSLVDAEVAMQYRVKTDGGLIDYMMFGSDELARRSHLTEREKAIRAIALREVTTHMARLTIDEVLSVRRTELISELLAEIQSALDQVRSGIDVIAVNIPMMRPSGDTAQTFEDLGKSHQARLEQIALAERNVATTLAFWVSDAATAEQVLDALDEWSELTSELGADAPETVEKRILIEDMLFESGGNAAQMIAAAERERWVELLAKRTRARRLEGQGLAYRAAPNLYMQRKLMEVYADSLAFARKYVVAIDPDRVNIDVELQDRNPLLNFTDALPDKEGDGGP